MPPTPPARTPAVRIFAHGGVEQLVYDEFELPDVGPRDILVEVAAASVSMWDVKYRIGLPPTAGHPGRAFFPLPQQLGREAAGTVLAVGDEVRRFAVGDRVVAVVHPDDPDSVEAMRGLQNLSRGVELPGHQGLGAYARYLVREERMWLPLPEGVELEQAALTLWPFSTAHRIVVDRLGVGLGETLLVTGAAGGMGQATVQLGRLLGARVIATTRSEAKVGALYELGATEVVLLDDLERAAAEVRELTGREGVGHAVEFSGDHATMAFVRDASGLGGRICVATGEQDPASLPFSAADFLRTELSLLGVRGARPNDARIALELLSQGRIRTPVAARFGLREVAAAHELLEGRHDLVGRIVLDPSR
jgi:NADPH:quinone reductase-like Zn-dependent oxidoreductase